MPFDKNSRLILLYEWLILYSLVCHIILRRQNELQPLKIRLKPIKQGGNTMQSSKKDIGTAKVFIFKSYNISERESPRF